MSASAACRQPYGASLNRTSNYTLQSLMRLFLIGGSPVPGGYRAAFILSILAFSASGPGRCLLSKWALLQDAIHAQCKSANFLPKALGYSCEAFKAFVPHLGCVRTQPRLRPAHSFLALSIVIALRKLLLEGVLLHTDAVLLAHLLLELFQPRT